MTTRTGWWTCRTPVAYESQFVYDGLGRLRIRREYPGAVRPAAGWPGRLDPLRPVVGV